METDAFLIASGQRRIKFRSLVVVLCYFTMSSSSCNNLYETARSAFAKNDLKCLIDLYSRLIPDVRPLCSIQEMLDNIYNSTHALSRNFGAEIYVPKHARDGKNKAFTAIRHLFCLYFSMLLASISAS